MKLRLAMARFGSPLFLVGYFASLVPPIATYAPTLLVPGLFALGLGTWDRATRSSRIYLALCVGLAAFASVLTSFDVQALVDSISALATIVGLLVVLKTIAFPLLATRYLVAVKAALNRLHERGVKGNFAASVLGLGIGQLLAFAIVPLVHQLMVVTANYRGHAVSRWVGRALSLTVLSAVAFPTVSIAIDILSIEVLSYLRFSVPITAVFAAALLVWSAVVPDETAPELAEARSATAGTGVGPDGRSYLGASGPGGGTSAEVDGGSASTVSIGPLYELAGYLVVLVAAMIVTSSTFEDVSYLAIISGVGFVMSVCMALVLLLARDRAPIREHGRYVRQWWKDTGPEVYVFLGGGFLLYGLAQTGALDALPELLVAASGAIGAPDAIYVLFSGLVFVLFMCGVHPTVSVLIICLAVAESMPAGTVDTALLALALMVGNVSALMPSPFSALSNLRSALSGIDVFRSIPENALFGITLFVAGNAYVIAIAQTL